jgi:hypothetical protein
MRVIGSPNARSEFFYDLNEDHLLRLFPLAIKNKVPLLFLGRAIDIRKDSKSLKNLYQAYLEKSRLALSLVREINKILTQTKINYVLFKTFKPFPFVRADVDIIFFNREDLKQAFHALRKEGYKLAGYGAFSITLFSPEHNMNVDLHLEISVSHMVYVNKQLLQEYVTEVDMDGDQIPILETPATLATVIAHSLYKEQMFTLSDYYETIIHMSNMTEQQRTSLVSLAEQTHVGFSVKAGLMLVNALAKVAFEKTVPAITETAQMIRVSEIEDRTIQLLLGHIANNFRLPYKYHAIAIAVAFMMKALRDPAMRGTLPHQFVEIITDTSYFLESTLFHMGRETY